MGFLCCNTRFPSLSPQIGERARERKERWLSPSQSYTSHDKWQRHRQTVHGESFVFLTVTLPHSLSHSAHTNLAHCSLSGMGADIKSRLCLSVIHSEDISLLSLGWCLNIELWPPVPAEVGVFDSKPTGTGQKNSLEAAASSAKVALVLLLSVSPLPPPPRFSFCHLASSLTTLLLAQLIIHAGSARGTIGPVPSEIDDIIHCACALVQSGFEAPVWSFGLD